MRTFQRIAVAVAMACVVGACGGGGGGSGTPPVPIDPGVDPPDPGPVVFTCNHDGGTAGELQTFQPACAVIGQMDLEGTTLNQGEAVPSERTLSVPTGSLAFADDGRLFVADRGNHRVLSYPGIPRTNNAPADLVLGQEGYSSNTPSIGEHSHPGPTAVAIGSGKMAVAHPGANRVILYDGIPRPGAPLPQAIVLGQAHFDTSDASCGPLGMNGPSGAAITPDGKLLVADRGNNRVLVWTTLPTSNNQAPNGVLGQPDFNECDPNAGGSIGSGRSARTLLGPQGVWSDGTIILVAATADHRVLMWDGFPSFPTSNFAPATRVLGQQGFTSVVNTEPPTDWSLRSPTAVTSDGVQVAIADAGNARVLIWRSLPEQNGQSAEIVLGQETAEEPVDVSHPPLEKATKVPTGVTFFGRKLLVTDTGRSGVLVFEPQ